MPPSNEWWEEEPYASEYGPSPGGGDVVKYDFPSILKESRRLVLLEAREVIECERIDVMNGGCGIKEHTHHKPKLWTWNRCLDALSLRLKNLMEK